MSSNTSGRSRGYRLRYLLCDTTNTLQPGLVNLIATMSRFRECKLHRVREGFKVRVSKVLAMR